MDFQWNLSEIKLMKRYDIFIVNFGWIFCFCWLFNDFNLHRWWWHQCHHQFFFLEQYCLLDFLFLLLSKIIIDTIWDLKDTICYSKICLFFCFSLLTKKKPVEWKLWRPLVSEVSQYVCVCVYLVSRYVFLNINLNHHMVIVPMFQSN